MSDKIIQVSGFGLQPNEYGNDYLLVALTESGKVILSTGDSNWGDVSPKIQQHATKEDNDDE